MNKINWKTGGAIVIANMIGTGAFTTLGFQLSYFRNTGSILLLWMVGGLIALAGAVSYSQLGVIFKKSGGEYTFLSKLFHPLVGYLSGWISLTVGFAAPVALSAIALTRYLGLEAGTAKAWSVGCILLVSVFHYYFYKF